MKKIKQFMKKLKTYKTPIFIIGGVLVVAAFFSESESSAVFAIIGFILIVYGAEPRDYML